jgi:carbamoyl-phosphate synthase large subunit
VTGERTTVLLTGVGIDGGPDIIRALRTDPVLQCRVVGVDVNPERPGRYMCDAFSVVPPRDDPSYVDSVVEVAERESAQVIYPLPSFDQELFARAKQDLESRGYAVPVSPVDAVETCNDKWLLYEEVGRAMPSVVPRTKPVSSVAELESAVRSFGYPEEPVCIRLNVSRGAMGFRVLDEGPARLKALVERNPGSSGSLVTSLPDVADSLRAADPFPGYLVQEYLPGDEWDVDVLCRDGESLIIATRHNVSMTVSAATRSELQPSEPIADLSQQIVAQLGLNAVVSLSFRQDSRGEPKLIEINPRIPFSILCSMSGDVNLVALAVRQALGERIEPIEPRWGGQFLIGFQSVITDNTGTPIDLAPPEPPA